jgi:multidrug transporter EmrE-like cation transporter
MSARLSTIVFLLLYVAISVTGLTLLKSQSEIFSARFVLGFLLYGLGFVMWYILLRMMPLSVAFPIAAGSLIAATQLVGSFFLDEKLGAMHLLGIAVIIAGVVLVFSQQ